MKGIKGGIGSEDISQAITLRKRFRIALRAMVGVSAAVMLLLCYSLLHVSRASAEFYISLLTMGLCLFLIAAALAVDLFLRRSIKKKQKELRVQAQKDKADPWILG